MTYIIKQNIVAEVLVENIIWNSFTEKQLASINNYYMTLFLLSQGFLNKEVREKLNIPLDSVSAWKNNHRIPYAIRILEEFEERYSKKYIEEDLLLLAYLVGYNLGDGNISRNFCNGDYICHQFVVFFNHYRFTHRNPGQNIKELISCLCCRHFNCLHILK